MATFQEISARIAGLLSGNAAIVVFWLPQQRRPTHVPSARKNVIS
jgi:hypothetical protein